MRIHSKVLTNTCYLSTSKIKYWYSNRLYLYSSLKCVRLVRVPTRQPTNVHIKTMTTWNYLTITGRLIQVLRKAFLLEIGTHPTPRNASIVGPHTFVKCICTDPHVPPTPPPLPHTQLRYTTLERFHTNN